MILNVEAVEVNLILKSLAVISEQSSVLVQKLHTQASSQLAPEPVMQAPVPAPVVHTPEPVVEPEAIAKARKGK